MPLIITAMSTDEKTRASCSIQKALGFDVAWLLYITKSIDLTQLKCMINIKFHARVDAYDRQFNPFCAKPVPHLPSQYDVRRYMLPTALPELQDFLFATTKSVAEDWRCVCRSNVPPSPRLKEAYNGVAHALYAAQIEGSSCALPADATRLSAWLDVYTRLRESDTPSVPCTLWHDTASVCFDDAPPQHCCEDGVFLFTPDHKLHGAHFGAPFCFDAHRAVSILKTQSAPTTVIGDEVFTRDETYTPSGHYTIKRQHARLGTQAHTATDVNIHPDTLSDAAIHISGTFDDAVSELIEPTSDAPRIQTGANGNSRSDTYKGVPKSFFHFKPLPKPDPPPESTPLPELVRSSLNRALHGTRTPRDVRAAISADKKNHKKWTDLTWLTDLLVRAFKKLAGFVTDPREILAALTNLYLYAVETAHRIRQAFICFSIIITVIGVAADLGYQDAIDSFTIVDYNSSSVMCLRGSTFQLGAAAVSVSTAGAGTYIFSMRAMLMALQVFRTNSQFMVNTGLMSRENATALVVATTPWAIAPPQAATPRVRQRPTGIDGAAMKKFFLEMYQNKTEYLNMTHPFDELPPPLDDDDEPSDDDIPVNATYTELADFIAQTGADGDDTIQFVMDLVGLHVNTSMSPDQRTQLIMLTDMLGLRTSTAPELPPEPSWLDLVKDLFKETAPPDADTEHAPKLNPQSVPALLRERWDAVTHASHEIYTDIPGGLTSSSQVTKSDHYELMLSAGNYKNLHTHLLKALKIVFKNTTDDRYFVSRYAEIKRLTHAQHIHVLQLLAGVAPRNLEELTELQARWESTAGDRARRLAAKQARTDAIDRANYITLAGVISLYLPKTAAQGCAIAVNAIRDVSFESLPARDVIMMLAGPTD